MNVIKNSLLALSLQVIPWGVSAADQPVDLRALLKQAKPETQVQWAGKYEHGEGIDQNYTSAMYLYCAAASKGYAPAQYRLGWLYANGRGVIRDDAMAAAWFKQAAAQGNAQAKNMLSMLAESTQTKKPLCVLPRTQNLVLKPGNFRPAASVSPEQRRRVEKLVRRLAPKYGLDPLLVLSVIQVESAFQAQAVSPKSAQGLMQLIPETADRFGVQDVMDPQQNLTGGMAYLRWLLAFFQGDVQLALAGYNAGENAVVKYQGIPPYPETQAYVERIIQLYGNPMHPPVAPVVRPASFVKPAYAVSVKEGSSALKAAKRGQRYPSKGANASLLPVKVTVRGSQKSATNSSSLSRWKSQTPTGSNY